MNNWKQNSNMHDDDADLDDMFEIELDYDCSHMTLEQSVAQVFTILYNAQLPTIEKKQAQALQDHIAHLIDE